MDQDEILDGIMERGESVANLAGNLRAAYINQDKAEILKAKLSLEMESRSLADLIAVLNGGHPLRP